MPQDLDFRRDAALSAILSSLQHGIAVYGADRKLLFINERMRRLTGGQQRVGVGLKGVRTRHRLFTLDGRELKEEEFPIELAFRGTDTPEATLEYVGADGARRWFLMNCIRILDADGALRYVVTSVHDISNRKHREDKLRFMVESAKILSLEADFKTRLIEKAKLAVPSLADWSAIDILTQDGKDTQRVAVIHEDPEQIALIDELQRRFPNAPEQRGSAFRAIVDQTPLFVPEITDAMLQASARSPEHLELMRKLQLRSIIVVPIVAHGKGLGALTLAFAQSGRTYSEDDLEFFQEYCAHVGVVLDNARLYDEILRRDRAKDLFLASLSHELRNPLAPIKSSLELLRFQDVSAPVREELGVIEHQFDHMARLLADLLDVSRFTQGMISLSLRTVELRKLLERALRSTESLLSTADITLHFTYSSAPLLVQADETRLEQAIVNLMSNAAKFTPAGGSIWVDLEKDGEGVLIRVRDNGAGIAAEDLPNIFRMYYQSRRSNSANSGLGIGLLLVEQIVRLHGGSVEARSGGPGLGSEFVIRLPIAAAAQGETVASPAARNAMQRRVLVVDDNIQAADSLVKLLNKLGATAEALYSGEETLARNDLHEYEVLLLDVGMPKIDGYQLVRALRERGIQAPVVALSGYGMAEDKKRALEAGFTVHLTKPVGMREITEAFESL